MVNSSLMFRIGTSRREGLGFELDHATCVYSSLFLFSGFRINSAHQKNFKQ